MMLIYCLFKNNRKNNIFYGSMGKKGSSGEALSARRAYINANQGAVKA
jgi:hypothetical protein